MTKEKLKKDGTTSKQGEGSLGRKPLKWNTPDELKECIEAYFKWSEENSKRLTVSRLAWWLGCSRQTILNYEKADENGWLKRCSEENIKSYVDTIRDVKRYIESEYEDSLFYKGSVNGAIFALKNNYGWVDKQEVITRNDNNIEIKLED